MLGDDISSEDWDGACWFADERNMLHSKLLWWLRLGCTGTRVAAWLRDMHPSFSHILHLSLPRALSLFPTCYLYRTLSFGIHSLGLYGVGLQSVLLYFSWMLIAFFRRAQLWHVQLWPVLCVSFVLEIGLFFNITIHTPVIYIAETLTLHVTQRNVTECTMS